MPEMSGPSGGISCSGWGEIFGQERAVSLLRSGISQGDIPHALLFTGPRGVGKFSTALLLAAALLCPSGEPDGCPSCLKVADGVHPDLHLVEPEGMTITVGRIREMEAELSRKPVEAGCRVVIVDDAELMNRESANAFLKTLEEPEPGTYIILVCESKESLLPTVVSRCREVRFSALGRGDVVRFLVEREGMGEEEAERLAGRSGGVFGRALLWARRPELTAHWRRGVGLAASLRRLSLLEALDEVGSFHRMLREVEAEPAEDAREERYRRALEGRAADLVARKREERRKRETARLRRQAMRDLLDGMSSFYRDIMLLNLAGEEGRTVADQDLFNPEWREELEREALHLGARQSLGCLRAVLRAEKALDANVDEALLLESLVLELRKNMR